MDLKCLRINGKHYVNLQEDIYVASTVRMKNTCLIKPPTAIIYYGKVRENPDLPTGQSYEIEQNDKGILINQPGLQIINTVATLMKNRTLPILVVNNTNKFIKIYRHGLIAKITGIQNNVTCIDIEESVRKTMRRCPWSGISLPLFMLTPDPPQKVLSICGLGICGIWHLFSKCWTSASSP